MSFLLALAIKNAKKLGLDRLSQELNQLKVSCPDKNAGRKIWEVWAKKLRAVMIKERNIGHKFNLNKKQITCLENYLYANKLIVDCLNCQSYVTNPVREEILDNLLIPPSL